MPRNSKNNNSCVMELLLTLSLDHSASRQFNYLELILSANYINCSTHIVINDKADEFHKTINVTKIVGWF